MSDLNETQKKQRILNDVDDAADAILAGWEERPEEDHSEPTEEATATKVDETDQGELFDDEDEAIEEVEVDDDEDLEDAEDEDEQDDDTEEAEETAEVLSEDSLVNVTVDGEDLQVSVSDLKRLYGQEASLTRKSQDVAQQRKIADANIEKTHVVMQKLLEKAQEQYKPYADVDMLLASRTMDASDFAQLRKEAQAAEENIKFLKSEADNFYNELKQQQQQTLKQQASEAVKVLQTEIPDWSNNLYNDIRAYAVSEGLPQEQVDQYVDPVVIKLLNKARMFDQGKKVAVKKKTTAKQQQRVLRSKKAPATKVDRRMAKAKEAQSKLRNSRDLDDIADAIMSRWEE
jgi:hypothetical protein